MLKLKWQKTIPRKKKEEKLSNVNEKVQWWNEMKWMNDTWLMKKCCNKCDENVQDSSESRIGTLQNTCACTYVKRFNFTDVSFRFNFVRNPFFFLGNKNYFAEIFDKKLNEKTNISLQQCLVYSRIKRQKGNKRKRKYRRYRTLIESLRETDT